MAEKRRYHGESYMDRSYRSERYSSGRTEGNLAVREDDRNYDEHVRRKNRRAADRALQKALRREKRIKTVVAVFVAAAVVVSAVVLLQVMSENTELNMNISSLEARITELTEQNNSRAYDIDSAVDLNYVIEVATGELGMVRGSVGQIRTYEDSESEYVQQLSDLPME